MYEPKLARFTSRDPLADDEAVLLSGQSEYAWNNSNLNTSDLKKVEFARTFQRRRPVQKSLPCQGEFV
ncbi:MAG: hypothetical protein Tsb009_10310 [Planctomycetaceae bacterium]